MSRSFFRKRLQRAGVIEKRPATIPLEKLEVSIDNDIALKVDIEDPAKISSYVHCTRGGPTRPLFGRDIQVGQVCSEVSKRRQERCCFRSKTVYRSVTLQRSISHRLHEEEFSTLWHSNSPSRHWRRQRKSRSLSNNHKRRCSNSSSSLEKTRRSRRKRNRTCDTLSSDKSSSQSIESGRLPSARLVPSSSRKDAFTKLTDNIGSQQQMLQGSSWKQYEYHRGYYSC